MALTKQVTKTVELVGDTTVTAYIKVESFSGNKDTINAHVVSRKDNASGEFVRFDNYTFAPDLSGKNFIAQAYEHLKTLPEFAGATDC